MQNRHPKVLAETDRIERLALQPLRFSKALGEPTPAVSVWRKAEESNPRPCGLPGFQDQSQTIQRDLPLLRRWPFASSGEFMARPRSRTAARTTYRNGADLSRVAPVHVLRAGLDTGLPLYRVRSCEPAQSWRCGPICLPPPSREEFKARRLSRCVSFHAAAARAAYSPGRVKQ